MLNGTGVSGYFNNSFRWSIPSKLCDVDTSWKATFPCCLSSLLLCCCHVDSFAHVAQCSQMYPLYWLKERYVLRQCVIMDSLPFLPGEHLLQFGVFCSTGGDANDFCRHLEPNKIRSLFCSFRHIWPQKYAYVTTVCHGRHTNDFQGHLVQNSILLPATL